MTLTPATLRLDLKCGNGAISPGEKCTKGPAIKVQSERSKKTTAKSKKAQRNLRRATIGLGALTLGTGIVIAARLERSRINTAGEFAARVAARTAAQRERIARMERQQQQAAASVENASDFMRGYGSSATRSATTTGARASRGAYSPPKGSTEWKISQVFKARVKRKTNSRTNPNPNVSAAWAKARIKTSASPYKGDPDVSAAFAPRRDSVWASGFAPDTYDI